MPPDPGPRVRRGARRGRPGRAGRPALLVDFGSTFTKLLLVDPQAGVMLARAYRPTTVDEGVEVGLRAGLADLARTPAPAAAALVAGPAPASPAAAPPGGCAWWPWAWCAS